MPQRCVIYLDGGGGAAGARASARSSGRQRTSRPPRTPSPAISPRWPPRSTQESALGVLLSFGEAQEAAMSIGTSNRLAMRSVRASTEAVIRRATLRSSACRTVGSGGRGLHAVSGTRSAHVLVARQARRRCRRPRGERLAVDDRPAPTVSAFANVTLLARPLLGREVDDRPSPSGTGELSRQTTVPSRSPRRSATPRSRCRRSCDLAGRRPPSPRRRARSRRRHVNVDVHLGPSEMLAIAQARQRRRLNRVPVQA
jgi:hypothetical protein